MWTAAITIISLFTNSTAKTFSSWTHEATLPVKSGGKRSGILGSETSFSCFAVHWVAKKHPGGGWESDKQKYCEGIDYRGCRVPFPSHLSKCSHNGFHRQTAAWSEVVVVELSVPHTCSTCSVMYGNPVTSFSMYMSKGTFSRTVYTITRLTNTKALSGEEVALMWKFTTRKYINSSQYKTHPHSCPLFNKWRHITWQLNVEGMDNTNSS